MAHTPLMLGTLNINSVEKAEPLLMEMARPFPAHLTLEECTCLVTVVWKVAHFSCAIETIGGAHFSHHLRKVGRKYS